MSDKKKVEIIQDALNHLDDDMIEKVDRLRSEAQYAAERKKFLRSSFPRRQVTAVAASICLLLIGSYAWDNYLSPSYNAPGGIHGTEQNGAGEDWDANGEQEHGTERAPNQESSSDSISDVNTENVEGTGQENPSDNEADAPEPNVPSDTDGDTCIPTEEPGELEPDHYAPSGDVYLLRDNYVKVTMMPHKAWTEDVALEVVLTKGVEIGSEFKGEMDRLIEELCNTPLIETQFAPEISATEEDMIYHLFFHKTDGTIVHVWIFDDGYVYYDDNKEFAMQIDAGVYRTMLKLLAMHW